MAQKKVSKSSTHQRTPEESQALTELERLKAENVARWKHLIEREERRYAFFSKYDIRFSKRDLN